MRRRFRHWRRSRPFWGGLWSILGGLIILAGPATAVKVILVAGQVVWMGITVGAVISIFGLFLWFQPAQRQLIGVLIVVASLVSFITSDFGGFFIGMVLGLVGGSMGFSWTLRKPRQAPAAPAPAIGSEPMSLAARLRD